MVEISLLWLVWCDDFLHSTTTSKLREEMLLGRCSLPSWTLKTGYKMKSEEKTCTTHSSSNRDHARKSYSKRCNKNIEGTKTCVVSHQWMFYALKIRSRIHYLLLGPLGKKGGSNIFMRSQLRSPFMIIVTLEVRGLNNPSPCKIWIVWEIDAKRQLGIQTLVSLSSEPEINFKIEHMSQFFYHHKLFLNWS
jgi:hypothetical protein